MKILSVGYPLFPVGADASGGAEQVLAQIDRYLAANRHESLVVAAAGSRVSGRLFESPAPSGEMTEAMRASARIAHLQVIEKVLKSERIDLIHFHGLDFQAYIPQTSLPMLATLHLPIDWYPLSTLELVNVQLNCVSHSQAAGTNIPVIENGIDIDEFRPAPGRDDYLLWLGRICPEKAVDAALRIAHRLDSRLIVAGPVHPMEVHQRYYADAVLPLLDAKRTHIGAVAGGHKRDLLARARCLIVPSLVAETSSLVSMEAISCGTPVVARRSGALPEVIADGETGLIAETEDGMAEAIRSIGRISPERCRRFAEKHFDANTMAARYVALYAKVMAQAAVRVSLAHAV